MMWVYWTECGLSFRTDGLRADRAEYWTGHRWVEVRRS